MQVIVYIMFFCLRNTLIRYKKSSGILIGATLIGVVVAGFIRWIRYLLCIVFDESEVVIKHLFKKSKHIAYEDMSAIFVNKIYKTNQSERGESKEYFSTWNFDIYCHNIGIYRISELQERQFWKLAYV